MTNIHDEVYSESLDHCTQKDHLVSFQRERAKEIERQTENLRSGIRTHQSFQKQPWKLEDNRAMPSNAGGKHFLNRNSTLHQTINKVKG